jgi:RNA polymerase sigma factor (sigma-70 family)
LEASALTHASRRGFLARRSPLLKLQGDGHLIAMARAGNPGAFETIVDRYQGRLLGFCRQMLGSTEDAEDILQEVFVNAYRAMLADEREINLRPWLYRIARNRCLNHLRKPTADAQESMDMVPAVEAASTAEKVHNREEFRQLLTDVGKLPETQRSALLLREMDAMSYEEIAQAMETSVPSVKSLLVRARISLAEASQARQLTCGEVRIDLAEAAEGLRKLSGPVRRHVRDCEECADFRSQLRSNDKVLAALVPVGPLLTFKGLIFSKLGLGGAGTGGAATATSAGATGAGAVGGIGAASGVGAALSSGGAAGGIGAIGGAIGGKAVAGVVTAAVITAGAVEVKQQVIPAEENGGATISREYRGATTALAPAHTATPVHVPPAPAQPTEPAPVTEPAPLETEATPQVDVVDKEVTDQSATGGIEDEGAEIDPHSTTGLNGAAPSGAKAGAPAGGGTVVVTVGGSPSPEAAPASPPAESSPPPSSPPAESTPPPAEQPAPPSSSSGAAEEDSAAEADSAAPKP